MNSFSSPPIRVSVTLLMLFQVSALFCRAFLTRHLAAAGVTSETVTFVAALSGFLLLGIFMWPVLVRERSALVSLFARPRSWRRLLANAVLIGIFVRLSWWAGAAAYILSGLAGPGDPGSAAGPVWWWSCPAPLAVAMTLLVTVLMTPLVEEVMSRGLILQSMLHRYGRRAAIAGSALMFAVLHEPSAIPYAYAFGVVAAVQMLHYRSLWSPLVSHATANALIVLDWQCLNGIWIPASTSPGLSLLAIGFALSCFLAALKLAMAAGAGAAGAPTPATR